MQERIHSTACRVVKNKANPTPAYLDNVSCKSNNCSVSQLWINLEWQIKATNILLLYTVTQSLFNFLPYLLFSLPDKVKQHWQLQLKKRLQPWQPETPPQNRLDLLIRCCMIIWHLWTHLDLSHPGGEERARDVSLHVPLALFAVSLLASPSVHCTRKSYLSPRGPVHQRVVHEGLQQGQ